MSLAEINSPSTAQHPQTEQAPPSSLIPRPVLFPPKIVLSLPKMRDHLPAHFQRTEQSQRRQGFPGFAQGQQGFVLFRLGKVALQSKPRLRIVQCLAETGPRLAVLPRWSEIPLQTMKHPRFALIQQ